MDLKMLVNQTSEIFEKLISLTAITISGERKIACMYEPSQKSWGEGRN
jgi:hypothetical protein